MVLQRILFFRSHYSNIIKQENKVRKIKAPIQIPQAQAHFNYDSFQHFSCFLLYYTLLCTWPVFIASDNVVDQ